MSRLMLDAVNRPGLDDLRRQRDLAAAAYRDAARAVLVAERSLARRLAFESFEKGHCNWCGSSAFTQYVVRKRRPTGEHICQDCAGRHRVLAPPTFLTEGKTG